MEFSALWHWWMCTKYLVLRCGTLEVGEFLRLLAVRLSGRNATSIPPHGLEYLDSRYLPHNPVCYRLHSQALYSAKLGNMLSEDTQTAGHYLAVGENHDEGLRAAPIQRSSKADLATHMQLCTQTALSCKAFVVYPQTAQATSSSLVSDPPLLALFPNSSFEPPTTEGTASKTSAIPFPCPFVPSHIASCPFFPCVFSCIVLLLSRFLIRKIRRTQSIGLSRSRTDFFGDTRRTSGAVHLGRSCSHRSTPNVNINNIIASLSTFPPSIKPKSR